MMSVCGQHLERIKNTMGQPAPKVLHEESTLLAMRESPTMGTIWIFEGEKSSDHKIMFL
jgi:hypothetical protein